MRTLLLLVVLLFLSGCASTGKNTGMTVRDPVSTPIVPYDKNDIGATAEFSPEAQLPRTTESLAKDVGAMTEDKGRAVPLTYDGHPSGAAREIRATARQTYLYAQLATNAYDEDDKFKLIEVDGPFNLTKSWMGFGARYFKIANPTAGKTCVVAFRGTDFFTSVDWIFGNFLNTQYEQGLAYFDDLRKGDECKDQAGRDQPIVVLGHSLGGAIATYISLRREQAPAFLFNTSPRLTRGSAKQNTRVAVSQYSEVLAAFRHLFILAGGTYTTVNCRGGGPIGRHSIRPLAECLTAIAASDVTSAKPMDPAVVSAEANGIKYDGQILRGQTLPRNAEDINPP